MEDQNPVPPPSATNPNTEPVSPVLPSSDTSTLPPVPTPIPSTAPKLDEPKLPVSDIPTPPVSPVIPTPSVAPVPPTFKKPRAFPIKLIIPIIIFIIIGAIASLLLKNPGSITSKTITYWGLWEPESVMRPLLDEFEKTHPGLKVDYKLQSLNEYRERLQTAMSKNQGPDVFRIHNSWIPMFRNNLAPIPPTIYSTAEFETTFYPAVKDTLRVGSNYVAIPLEYDGLVMYVNNDLLAQNKVSVPTTWDDLKQVAIAISRCDTPSGTCLPGSQVLVAGTALGSTENVDHWQDVVSVLMLQNNVDLNSPSGQPAQDVLDYFSNFTRTFGIWSANLPTSTNFFAAGKVGIYFGPSWRVFDIKKLNPNLNFSLYSIPQLPVDPTHGEQPTTWGTYWVEGVNSKSSTANESWELLKFLSSKEIQPKFFQSAQASGRDFGEPYSRQDLADQLISHPFLSSVVSQAQSSRSWYIASATSDGPNGLNTLLSNAFANSLNSKSTITELATEIAQILSQYGLAAPLPAK